MTLSSLGKRDLIQDKSKTELQSGSFPKNKKSSLYGSIKGGHIYYAGMSAI